MMAQRVGTQAEVHKKETEREQLLSYPYLETFGREAGRGIWVVQ